MSAIFFVFLYDSHTTFKYITDRLIGNNYTMKTLVDINKLQAVYELWYHVCFYEFKLISIMLEYMVL